MGQLFQTGVQRTTWIIRSLPDPWPRYVVVMVTSVVVMVTSVDVMVTRVPRSLRDLNNQMSIIVVYLLNYQNSAL